ncbi:MAG: hypothetical protein ACYC2T_10315, partial [Bacillota bacterium]
LNLYRILPYYTKYVTSEEGDGSLFRRSSWLTFYLTKTLREAENLIYQAKEGNDYAKTALLQCI